MNAAHAPFRGTGYGLNIASDVSVHGMVALPASPASDADIVIRLGQTPALVGGTTSGPYTLGTDGLLFETPGVARYWAQGTDHLTIEPATGAAMDHVSDLLIATALPMLLWRRGGVLLHAACVQLPGCTTAIAIAGPSGSGKSTIAAQLIAAGAQLVADDSTWLHRDGQATGLHGGYFQRTGSGDKRAFITLTPKQQRPAAPLGAIIVLEPHPPNNSQVPTRLPPLNALEMLLRHRHRPRIPAILGLERDGFSECVLHSRSIPTYAVAPKDDENTGSHQHIIDFISKI